MAVLTKPMDSGSAVINSTATNFNTPAKDVLAMADRLGKDGNDPASILKLMQGELRGEQQAIQQEIAKGHAAEIMNSKGLSVEDNGKSTPDLQSAVDTSQQPGLER